MRLISNLKKQTWVLIFACASMFVLGVADNTRGPSFSDLISFFHLTNTEASSSFAIASAASFLGSFFSNHALKRITLDALLKISLALMALGLFIMAIASNYFSYLFGASVFGLSMGLMGVAQNLMVAEGFESNVQRKALSGLHGLYGLSSLIAPLLVAKSAVYFGPWRSAFYITALLSAIIFLFSVLTRANPSFVVHEMDEDSSLAKASKKKLFAFGLLFASYVVAEILVSSRLALYMRTYFNMDLEHSSLYVTYFFLFLLIGRILFAVKSFTLSIKNQLNGALFFSLFFILLGLYIHPFFLALTGLAMAPLYPLLVAYISEQTGNQKRTFITFAISFQSLCVITMHLGVGFITDLYGLFYAFGVGIVSLILCVICLNFHP